MTKQEAYDRIAGELLVLEETELHARFRIGEAIHAIIQSKDTEQISAACNKIADKIFSITRISRSWNWYYTCLLMHRRTTPNQRRDLLRHPYVTQSWVARAVRQGDEGRREYMLDVKDRKARWFAEFDKKKADRPEKDTADSSGPLTISWPVDLEEVELVVSLLYADIKRSLDYKPEDLDKAWQEGRRRAGI